MTLPTPRRSRLVVLAAFSALGVAWGAWGAVLPGIRHVTQTSEAELGAALLLVAVGAVPAMLAAPRLLVRWPRGTLPASIVVLGGGFASAGACRSLGQLSAALLLIGAASGLVDVAANIAATRLEAAAARPLLQLGHGSFSASVVVAALATGLARGGGAGPLAVLGTAAVVMTALALFVAGVPVPGAPSTSRGGPRVVERFLVVLGVLAAIALAIESGFQTWSAEHLESVLGTGPGLGGAGTAVFAAGAAIGRLAAYRRGPTLGDRRLFALGALTGAAGCVVAAVAPVPVVALAGIGVAGAGISVIFPLLVGQAARRRPDAPERAVSTVTVLGYTGFLVSPPLVGAIAQPFSLRVSFAVLAALAAVLAYAGPRALSRADGSSCTG